MRPADSPGARATRASRWHVSPSVDLSCYAFSWVAMAIPLAWLLDPGDPRAFAVALVTTSITDLHRHYTLPYVYLDATVRQRFPLRFVLLPALFFALWTQTPALARSALPISATAVGAVLGWLIFAIQLMRQDRGGAAQLRAALPCFLIPLGLSSLVTLATTSGGAPPIDAGSVPVASPDESAWLAGSWVDSAWVWLASAVAGSCALHAVSRTDSMVDPYAGTRAPVAFPIAVALVALVVPVALDAHTSQPSVRSVFNLVLVLFLLWHFYHVLMQKYGILRIYSAKSGQQSKVPGWVDRWLLFSILPLIFVWVSCYELDTLVDQLGYQRRGLGRMVLPTLRFVQEHSTWLLSASIAFVLAAVATFVRFEWRTHRFGNLPRLGFAAGTLLFYSTFFALGLFGFYSVFSFAHGVEYMVFIWAFQRKRYREPGQHARVLGRLVRHPFAFYTSFTLVVVAAIVIARYRERFPVLALGPDRIFGETPMEWIRWYTVYQGILHFYYDGFLWKLRRPELRREM